MIEGISSGISYPSPPSNTQTPRARAVPETASPFEIAQEIQDVQVDNFKRTLDAQTQILDLLV